MTPPASPSSPWRGMLVLVHAPVFPAQRGTSPPPAATRAPPSLGSVSSRAGPAGAQNRPGAKTFCPSLVLTSNKIDDSQYLSSSSSLTSAVHGSVAGAVTGIQVMSLSSLLMGPRPRNRRGLQKTRIVEAALSTCSHPPLLA